MDTERFTIPGCAEVGVDRSVDAIHFRLTDATPAKTIKMSDDLFVDYDFEGNIVGFEVLNAGL